MIKTLQKKFTLTAMTAITILLLFLLGAINITNIAIVRKEAVKTLFMISEAEGDFGHVKVSSDPVPPPHFMVEPKDERDKFISSNFFTVRFNKEGEIIKTDVSRTPSMEEESAGKLAMEAYCTGKDMGKIKEYRYRAKSIPSGEMVVVFLNTSEEIFSYVRVLLLSAGMGFACWILMLLLVIFLSGKAIRPIAENMEKQKQFVTNAGHEIKTPLAIILANTDAMELYNGENKWSRNIREQVIRLNGLMKNLLLLAKMDEGAQKEETEEVLLSGLLEESIQDFTEPVKLKRITLESQLKPDVMLRANKEQLRQLISILMDNAVKYTNEGGFIRILLQKKESNLFLEIKNSCENRPEGEFDKLFDRFYRGDKARTQKNGGYGIGLSVAESIVRANKGSISVQYEDPDFISFIVKF